MIAAKLLVPEQEDEGGVECGIASVGGRQIVAIADIVMSLDNVIAVAAAANGSVPLLVLGLAISVPLIVAGAALIMALLEPLADPGMGRRGAAGLDRRRGHGDRSGDSSEARCASSTVRSAPSLDGMLASLGMGPQFANGGNGGEVVLGVLGIIVVLVAGSIWRKRTLQKHAGEFRRSGVRRSERRARRAGAS